ncbi:DUF1801 domain-containing protein [Aliiroseovarius sp. F20344]|uniref:DUF1801 domain-containing protein n=1 Tax=Aliiroseovarius sp. F20344 TaxID=2926414 RepID=UPI001FF4904C|nr:DUF1801 domain-containing protein [Aliiroseovarius sp. F20344]MCK0142819.1 DUF1801 domain-containing protein [Aliiroseovarius sp. F20344]
MTSKIDQVDDYIGKCNAPVVPLLKDLRAYIHATLPGASEDMQYGVPVFLNAHGAPVLYLFGSKEYVNFGFLRSSELSDPNGVLEGSGKPSKHIRVLPGRPVDWAGLTAFVTQCESISSDARNTMH